MRIHIAVLRSYPLVSRRDHGLQSQRIRNTLDRTMATMSLSDLSITRLKGSIKGDIVTPNDTSYTAAIARWSRLAERQAAAVVFVRDEDDVASAIKFAREHGLELAVKGKYIYLIPVKQSSY